MKKKFYVKALDMIIDEMTDCDWCNCKDDHGKCIFHPADCTEVFCKKNITAHWLEKAKRELKKEGY